LTQRFSVVRYLAI
ncbi:hypothetical protein VCCP1035_2475B, partial [Vibrio cholerae CP1035(8)]